MVIGVKRRSLAWLIALAGVAALGASATAAQTSVSTVRVRAHVHLLVLRSFPRAWIEPIAEALERDLQVQAIAVSGSVPLPRFAWYAPRRRWRAERLLRFLIDRYEGQPATTRVLGLTSRDISTTKEPHEDWGILGLSNVPGRAAVVSSFRMRRRARSPRHALWRMTTTAVHEVGHALGLEHCEEPRCLMRDAEGTMDTVDAGDGSLGPQCVSDLARTAPRRLARLP